MRWRYSRLGSRRRLRHLLGDRTNPTAPFGNVTRIAALDPGGVDATAPYITPDGLSLYYQVGLPDGTLTITTHGDPRGHVRAGRAGWRPAR